MSGSYNSALLPATAAVFGSCSASVTDADVTAFEQKSVSQEDCLLAAMLARKNGSLADWAQDCGWRLKGEPGQPDKPYKSLVERLMKRLQRDKLVTKIGRGYTLTKAGKIAAQDALKNQ